jgi:amidohydrolase
LENNVAVNEIKQLAERYAAKVVAIRHHLHANPELSFKEFKTAEFIAGELKKAGISYTTGHAGTGIVALIEGKDPGKKTVLLRADMDALPIEEKNDVEYRSKNTGVMHACGHDVHSSCALGAAFILNELRASFSGTIKIMFQPGEEVLPGGASLMIKEGVLEDPKVHKAIALHVFPEMETGKVGFRGGMYMASTDELYITVTGKGGHAAMPANYHNPLIAASEILLEVERTFMLPASLKGTPGENIPTVVAFGKIEGKGATNVIPEKVEMAGTMRTMDEQWRSEIHHRLTQLVSAIGDKRGVKARLKIEHGYPFLVNDKAFTESCMNAAKDFLGKENVEELATRMTAEDFAFITQKVPSCFFRLGTGNKARGITSGVHTPTFDIDESALQIGIGLLSWLLVSELNR